MTVLDRVIAEREVIYRPSLRLVTGSVNGAIVLRQIMFWWDVSNGKPFYKFMQPCNHQWYKKGDSWSEELGLSWRELNTALKGFACRVTKGISLFEAEGKYPVVYWKDKHKVTWWQFNSPIFNTLYNRATRDYIYNCDMREHISNQQEREFINTENTTEKYTAPEKKPALTAENYKEQIAAAAAAHQNRNGADLAWLEEDLRPLAQAFVKAAGKNHEPIKAEYSLWRKELNKWRELHITPKAVDNAIQYMRQEGLTIKSPMSVTGIARDGKAPNAISLGMQADEVIPIFRA